jgi:hypothetical protein
MSTYLFGFAVLWRLKHHETFEFASKHIIEALRHNTMVPIDFILRRDICRELKESTPRQLCTYVLCLRV